MNDDRIEEMWPQIAGKARNRWRKLTEDDVGFPGGNTRYLVAVLQERYRVDRREAWLEVHEFDSELGRLY